MIDNWKEFVYRINEYGPTNSETTNVAQDPQKIYDRVGDPYKYRVERDHWMAKKSSHTKWYEITGADFRDAYQVSIDILDTEFPNARTPNAPKRTVPKPAVEEALPAQLPQPPQNNTGASSSTNSSPAATSGDSGNTTKKLEETPSVPTPAITIDPEIDKKPMSTLEKNGSVIYARLMKAKTLFFRLGSRSNVMVYKGQDLSEEEKSALVAYMRFIGFRMSRYNNDFRKGDKLIFKRGLEETSSEKEKGSEENKNIKESGYFDGVEGASAIDQKILELFKKDIINFNKGSETNEQGVRELEVLVKSNPMSSKDGKVFSEYFGQCGLVAFPKITDQKEQQIKNGKSEIHIYKYIPETKSVEIKDNNILSVFLHFYYQGEMKKRFLSKKFMFKGRELDDNTKNKLEEFVSAINHKQQVKFQEEKTNDSYIYGYEDFSNMM
jgi:hypothetical protein